MKDTQNPNPTLNAQPSPPDPAGTASHLELQTSNVNVALHFRPVALQSPQTRRGTKPRNGKIARLPKLERDMVNRMLANNLPHHKITAALDELGFHVTGRNVSNWKTHGGYNEWRAAQEQALELRTFQDNLTEFLRRHDASELPEVGLQSAATSLSALLLRPDLMRDLLADPQKYSKLIEIQCRLAREIRALQKDRDDAAKSFGDEYDPECIKRQDEQDVENIREVYSSKLGKSEREAAIPHRNFIPRELDPVPPHPVPPLTVEQIKQLNSSPTTDPEPRRANQSKPGRKRS